jgi:hypothetical protein
MIELKFEILRDEPMGAGIFRSGQWRDIYWLTGFFSGRGKGHFSTEQSLE